MNYEFTTDISGILCRIQYQVYEGSLGEVLHVAFVAKDDGLKKTEIDANDFYDDFASFAEAVDAACQEDYENNHEEESPDEPEELGEEDE